MIFLFPELWKENRIDGPKRFVRLVNGNKYYINQGNFLSKWQQVKRLIGPVWIAVGQPYWEYETWYSRA